MNGPGRGPRGDKSKRGAKNSALKNASSVFGTALKVHDNEIKRFGGVLPCQIAGWLGQRWAKKT